MKTIRTGLTEEQKQFIKDNYQTMIYMDIAKALNITESKVANWINKNGLRLSPEEFERRKKLNRFKKNQTAWNKGLSLPNKPNSGQFQKGHLPHNTKADGFITWRTRPKRKNQDYYWIRISLGKWVELHVHIWEKANGPVPKGKILRFKDGNHRNCVLENLELIDRIKHMDLNRNYSTDRMKSDKVIAGYITRDPKLKKEILNHPELIEAKRQQLILEKRLNETRRQA